MPTVAPCVCRATDTEANGSGPPVKTFNLSLCLYRNSLVMAELSFIWSICSGCRWLEELMMTVWRSSSVGGTGRRETALLAHPDHCR